MVLRFSQVPFPAAPRWFRRGLGNLRHWHQLERYRQVLLHIGGVTVDASANGVREAIRAEVPAQLFDHAFSVFRRRVVADDQSVLMP